MSEQTMPDELDLNTDAPHSARIYDYLLGGKDHFQADRDGRLSLSWLHLVALL